jgi:putative peptidoglycan lipid II flippase
MLYFAVPVSVLLAVLRIPVVRLVLGSGLFDWPATVATATTLSLFAIGIFAQAGFLLVTRAFYAMHDTVTPLKIAVISLIFHVSLSYYLVFVYGKNSALPVSYLGLATSISGMFSFFTLFFLLNKRLQNFDRKQLFYPLVKIVVPALLMAVVLYVPLHLRLPNGEFVIDMIIDTKRVLNLLFLTVLVSLSGLAVYVLTTWWFKSEELYNFVKMIPDIRKVNKILEFEEPVDTTHTAPHA